MARKADNPATNRRAHWLEQIDKQTKAYSDFVVSGDKVVDQYRIEQATAAQKDKYNILYSTTETVRPSIYAQTPKAEVSPRHRDRKNPLVFQAITLLETSLSYAIADMDFDEVIENCVDDYLLPGWGVAWVRYIPTFKPEVDDAGKPVVDEKGQPRQQVDYEAVGLDYIHWKDAIFGPARVWAEMPWVGKRVYFNKAKATKRFGADKANMLSYTAQDSKGQKESAVQDGKQAIIYEIWDKESGTVYWVSEGYPDDVLDAMADPLKLKDFFPTPRPMRAITNTRKFQPRNFFSQYQAQAEELNRLTYRIRLLTEALQARGVYDASMDALKTLLAANGGNKMIPVENWAQFAQNGGVEKSIAWLPITEIAAVLMQCYDARERVKAEIYEITGFSDIVRGVSKASETLGAQQIKTDWASARLKRMQKEVQRYVRDLIRLMGEIIAEHFSPETLAIYSGFDVADMDEASRAQASILFKSAVNLLKTERDRCANIGIETDSTIMADEAEERKDRMDFMGAIGAFLQQAGPMAMQYPEMRGLLMSLMMFGVRTFRASRPIEQEFEKFQEAFAAAPPMDPNGNKDGAAKPDPAVEQAKIAADQDTAQAEAAHKTAQLEADSQLKKYEIDQRTTMEREKETNRHNEKMSELGLREREVAVKEAELGIKRTEVANEAELAANAQQHEQQVDVQNLNNEDRRMSNEEQNTQVQQANETARTESDIKVAQTPSAETKK